MQQRIKGKKRFALLGTLLALLLLALGALGYWLLKENTLDESQWDALYETGVYHEGICVDGIHIGKMTMAQAFSAVEENMQERLDQIRFVLLHEGREFALTREDFIVTHDIETILKEAMRLAREGSLLAVHRQVEDIRKNKREFFTDYAIDPASIAAAVGRIAAQIDTAPEDARLEIHKTGNTRFTYIEAINGKQTERDALAETIAGRAAVRKYGEIEIPVETILAAVTADTLRQKTALRAQTHTSFARSPYNRTERVFNIRKAVGIINGYVLKTGETFSTNDVLGPRTYDRGWKPAPAIVRGGSEDQAGGGVCQVSSTMYNAVLKAGLEVTSRRGHSIRLSYVDGGLDATINTGTIDFAYKNSTQEDIYLFCRVDEKKKQVHFEIYGVPFPPEYDEIRLWSKKIRTIRPDGELLVTVDNTKPPGYREEVVKRRNGSVYHSYKSFYKDGKKALSDEFITETVYKAYAGEVIVGPEPEPEPEPTPGPEAPQTP